MIIHIDEIIYLKDLKSHIIHFHQVLSQLLQQQFFVKAENCEFLNDTIALLGYIISPYKDYNACSEHLFALSSNRYSKKLGPNSRHRVILEPLPVTQPSWSYHSSESCHQPP